MGTVSSPDAQTRLVPGTTNNLPAKLLMALLGPREMSDLSQQGGAKRTLIRSMAFPP
jgi:hypothetical protein